MFDCLAIAVVDKAEDEREPRAHCRLEVGNGQDGSRVEVEEDEAAFRGTSFRDGGPTLMGIGEV